MDCELYSLTKTIFEHLNMFIVEGPVVLFDECFNYPSWHDHVLKAWQESVAENNVTYEYFAYAPRQYSVALKVTSRA